MSNESDLKSQEESIKTIIIQEIVSSFFSLLAQKQRVLYELKFKYGGVTYVGVDALEKLYDVFGEYTIKNAEKNENNEMIWGVVESNIGHSLPLSGRNLTIRDSIESYLQCYNAIVQYGSWGLEIYYGYLYDVIKFVDNFGLFSDEEKYTYISILRNQMSDSELLMLFYFCLSNEKFKNLKLLIERYVFFENLPKEKVLTVIHLDWYSESAYGFYPKEKKDN